MGKRHETAQKCVQMARPKSAVCDQGKEKEQQSREAIILIKITEQNKTENCLLFAARMVMFAQESKREEDKRRRRINCNKADQIVACEMEVKGRFERGYKHSWISQ